MIERYARPEMAAIWSEETKVSHWLRIEILAVEARAARGQVPQRDLEELRSRAAFDLERIKDLEQKTQHEVAAFLDNVAEVVGPAARHLHYGMTSSDVLDTALALQMRDSADLLLSELGRLIASVAEFARTHARTLLAARTHGVHAEPTTLGVKAAGWAWELHRAGVRLQRARDAVAVGKLSGVVGTYSQLSPEIEEEVCGALGLSPDPASTQVISRDRHAEFVAALAILGGSIERMAIELRHLARTEVREVEEPFAEGEQKGSSAMPHKRNPWRSERLVGLARMVRSGVAPAVENIALWHERDISHSSVERLLLPEVCMLVDFMLAEAAEVVGGLRVFPERMRTNLDLSYGLIFSQRVMLDLIDAGMSRDEAYRLVQEAATEAWGTQTHLRDLLAKRPEVTSQLSPEKIERCFDETRYLVHAEEIVERLSRLESS